jgi:hypothetical protein
MKVSEALDYLGAKRVIWIDDCFNDTPAQLARLLVNSLETAKACEFPELASALESHQFDPSRAEASIVQILTDAEPDRVAAIKATFFDREGVQKEFATGELSAAAIERTCELLGVTADDRWTFDKADGQLAALLAAGDADVSYVVDLNEAGGSKIRGLDILRTLWDGNSAGTAFILTHESDAAGESRREAELRQAFADAGRANPLGIPICVIAKERLYGNSDAPNAMEEALRIAIKRAGLRRSVFEVLARARGELEFAFDEAATRLLSIPPEQLEAHVFERGYKEGVSELHVVERALTAHIAQHLRSFFGVDEAVQRSARRLRALRNIELNSIGAPPDANLAAFRQAEVWESDAVINRAYTPIACGDVFETDASELATKSSTKRFVLLGQPCDISLRPDDKKRAQDTAFMVPLKKKGLSATDRDPKAPLLPFKLDGDQWSCDFRNATMVKLSVLDLASFRSDGRVCVDEGHAPSGDLLVGQHKVYQERTAAAAKALQAAIPILSGSGAVDANLQLSFASNDAFKHIHCATFEAESRTKTDGVLTIHPKRVTWRLRRCGRVRMPYAASMLDQYVSVMSRQAFDLDYMTPGLGDGEQVPALGIEPPVTQVAGAEPTRLGPADPIEAQQSSRLAEAGRDDRVEPDQLLRTNNTTEPKPVLEEVSERPNTTALPTDGAAPSR